jgi:hypothetical protein
MRIGMSGAAAHKVVGLMSGVLELAVRAKRLPANPAAGVELPHSKTRRKRYLTADQVEVMAEAARTLRPTRSAGIEGVHRPGRAFRPPTSKLASWTSSVTKTCGTPSR